MIGDPKFNTAKDWFEKLRDNLVEIIQNIDENKFEITNWDHKDEGGGKMSKLKGNIIEKGGVNISTCLLYTSPSPRDRQKSRMPSSA